MLGKLLGVTIIASDLEHTVDVYGKYLGYVPAERGLVSDAQARAWGAAAAAGSRYVTLQPLGGEESFIRLIESGISPDYHPLTTVGWNAAEIVVRDLDRLAEELANSPFKIIGPPAVLDFDFTDKIRAMQVVGLNGEVLYLTEITGDVPGFDLPKPRKDVGRIFVAVLGGRSISDMRRQLKDSLDFDLSEPFATKVSILSDAYGLDGESKLHIAAGTLPEQTLIELDEYPSTAKVRPRAANGLPMGIAMASFKANATLRAKATAIEGTGDAVFIGPDHSIWEMIA